MSPLDDSTVRQVMRRIEIHWKSWNTVRHNDYWHTWYRRPYNARMRDRVRPQLRAPFDESVWDPDVVALNYDEGEYESGEWHE